MLLGKRDAKPRYLCVIELAAFTVQMQLVDTQSGKEMWSHTAIVRSSAKSIATVSVKDLELALFEALMKYSSQGLISLSKSKKVNDSIQYKVIFMTPWGHACSKRVMLTKVKPFAITTEVLQELEEKAIKESEKTTEELFTEENVKPRLLGTAVVECTVNGYALADPEGVIGHELCNTYWLYYVHNKIVEMVKENIDKININGDIEFCTSLGYYLKESHSQPSEVSSNYLVITEANSTTIVVTSEFKLEKVIVVPYGYQTTSAVIGKILKVSSSEASVCLKSTCSDLTKGLSKKKETDFKKVFAKYNDELEKNFRKVSNQLIMPEKVHLVCPPEYREYMDKTISRIFKGIFNKQPRVVKIDARPWRSA